MSQIPLQQQTGTFQIFRIVVVCEAVVFLFAATLHTGAFGVPALYAAMIVEGLCGLGCVLSAYALFTRRRWARTNAITTQILILAAVLVGISAVTTDPGIRTPLNLGLHGIMLVLIVMGLSLLCLASTRAGFRSRHATRSGEE